MSNFIALLQLQHGPQVLDGYSLASFLRLYHLASIRCCPRQLAAFHAAGARVVLRHGGSNTAAQLPAGTAMTTALVPLASRLVQAFRRPGVIPPDPASTSAAISPTVLRTIDVFTPHLCSIGPANADEDNAGVAEREALGQQMVVALPQQRQYLEPPALSGCRVTSTALVRFDHSSDTTKAGVPQRSLGSTYALSPQTNIHLVAPALLAGTVAMLDGDPSDESAPAPVMWRRSIPTAPSGTHCHTTDIDRSPLSARTSPRGVSPRARGRSRVRQVPTSSRARDARPSPPRRVSSRSPPRPSSPRRPGTTASAAAARPSSPFPAGSAGCSVDTSRFGPQEVRACGFAVGLLSSHSK